MSIATEAYRICRNSAAAHGGGVLENVRMVVGELSAIEPALLATAWEALVSAGPDAGCRLDVEFRPVVQHCPACGPIAERAAGTWLRLCPRCDGPLHLEGGQELDILEISLRIPDV